MKNLTLETYQKRKDKFFYDQVSKKYKASQLEDFFISNILRDRLWIGDLLEDAAEENYFEYLKRKQAFSYFFAKEIEALFGSLKNPQDVFKIIDGQYPQVINRYMTRALSVESFAVLNAHLKFTDTYDDLLGKDDVVWSRLRLLSRKIIPFIDFDKDKIKSILKSVSITE